MSIPASWSELLVNEKLAELSRQNLAYFASAPPIEGKATPERYFEASEAAASLAVLDTPDAPAVALAKGVPGLARALWWLEHGGGDEPGYLLAFAALMNVAECCRIADYRAADIPAGAMMDTLRSAELEREERFQAGFCALGLGRADVVPELVRAAPVAFRPGQTFDYNLQAYLTYLAAAVSVRADQVDAEPALRAFAQTLPRALHDHKSTWGDLFWAARVHFHVLGGLPVAQVGAALHAYVRAL